MANQTPADEKRSVGAPKHHVDRSHYGDRLRVWMADRLDADAGSVTISDLDIPVATGFSNETVFFTAHWVDGNDPHEERFVARIEPADGGLFPVQTAATAVSVELQQRIMSHLADPATGADATKAPMPATLGHEPDPAVLGQPFFVMRFIDGVIPTDHPRYSQEGFLVDEATPAERTRMVQTGLEAMAAIHAVDWQAAGLDWLDASGNCSPTQQTQLALYRRYVDDELAGREHPVLARALDWLEANDPADERIGLSWGDARLGNIIWQGYRPAAVVDWEACALSPTEADLGWWLMFDRQSFDDVGAARMEGFPTRTEMISHYEAVSGREVRDPHYWEVFATMRFCAIFIRLADRLVAAGLVPAERSPFAENHVTTALAILLDEGPRP
jgi:aminoglycoside phosphotransferase (APT) family kinase protein